MKEDVLEIIRHYGVSNQLRQFTEEYFELVEAILNAENYEPNREDSMEKVNCNVNAYVEHVAEEIADCMVLLEQFKLYYGITSEEITKVFWNKVARTNKRIESEEK